MSPRVGAVSDGMGGHRGGERAAEITIAALERVVADVGTGPWSERALAEAFVRANDEVRRQRFVDRTVSQMGATLTAAALAAVPPGASEWIVAHVGDSPAFVIGADEAHQVNVDHTVPGQLVDDGSITAAEALVHPLRNMLLRAIGSEPGIVADFTHVRLVSGQSLVLMSDGISGVLDPPLLRDVVQATGTADAAARALVDAAIEHRASDNVTAVVLRHVVS